MMQIAKTGNGKVLPEDEAKLKTALQNFLAAIFTNRRFARLSAFKQKKIATGMKDFAVTRIARNAIRIYALNDLIRLCDVNDN